MASLTEAASAILRLQESATSAKQGADWETAANVLVLNVQIDWILAADPADSAWLQANRKFVKNTGLVPVVLNYNGQAFTFTNGVAYCAAPNEVAFFVAQSTEKGYSVVETTFAQWVIDNGGSASFYFQ